MKLSDMIAKQKQQEAKAEDAKPAEQANTPTVQGTEQKTGSIFKKPLAVPTVIAKPATPAVPNRSIFQIAARKRADTSGTSEAAELGSAKVENEKPNPFRFAKPSIKQAQGEKVALEDIVSGDSPDLDALGNYELEAAKQFSHDEQPEGYTQEEVEHVRNAFKLLEANMDNKEALASCVRTVVSTLQANPNTREILRPEDLGLMVRGLRQSAGILASKKQARATKKNVNEDRVGSFMQGFKDLGISLK